MSFFADISAAIGTPVLLDQFAEDVAYCPTGGSVRTISAMVEREQVSEQKGTNISTHEEEIVVTAQRSATLGFVDPQLKDYVQLPGDARPTDKWDFIRVEPSGPDLISARFRRSRAQRSGQMRPANL